MTTLIRVFRRPVRTTTLATGIKVVELRNGTIKIY